jgi:aspartate carbamoyltransferase regulatory subunit
MKNKIRRNVSLDQDTIDIIEAYSLKNNGEKNLSSGIRSLARNTVLFNTTKSECCNKCNSTNIIETGLALLTNPAQYEMRCNYCGNIFYTKKEINK